MRGLMSRGDGSILREFVSSYRSALVLAIATLRSHNLLTWQLIQPVFGSADIKAQLPAEWSRFKSVDGEFIQLMRSIAHHPFAMEALNIENLQRTLERLSNLMTVIQKALGAYLEKQRSDFSRFYFLGGEF